MTVLGPLFITFLSLFLTQNHLVSAKDSIPPDNWNATGGRPLPRSYFWPSHFDLHKDKDDVVVHLNNAHYHPYTICANKTNPRGFLIRSIDDKVVLDAQDDQDAHCHHAHTYLASPHVNYTIAPRGTKTDKWWMSVLGKDGKMNDFIYHRSHHDSTGDVRYYSNQTLAATISFTEWATEHQPEQLVMLDIEPNVSVETKYFIGLWTMVKIRMDRCNE